MSVPNDSNPAVQRDPVGQRRPFLAVAILLVGIVSGAILWQMRPREDEAQNPRNGLNPGGFLSKSGGPSSVRSPRIRWASEVSIPDDALVAGVMVGEKPRAYHLGVFRSPNWCIVNDLINDIPISVTYNEFEKKVRVYTDRYRGSPMELMHRITIATDRKGAETRMVMSMDNVQYFQDSGEPVDNSDSTRKKLTTYPFEQMTWKEWREAHPNTEIYTRVFGIE